MTGTPGGSVDTSKDVTPTNQNNGSRRGEASCRNGQNNQIHKDTTTITKVKGTVACLACLGTNEEKREDSFITFKKELHGFFFLN